MNGIFAHSPNMGHFSIIPMPFKNEQLVYQIVLKHIKIEELCDIIMQYYSFSMSYKNIHVDFNPQAPSKIKTFIDDCNSIINGGDKKLDLDSTIDTFKTGQFKISNDVPIMAPPERDDSTTNSSTWYSTGSSTVGPSIKDANTRYFISNVIDGENGSLCLACNLDQPLHNTMDGIWSLFGASADSNSNCIDKNEYMCAVVTIPYTAIFDAWNMDFKQSKDVNTWKKFVKTNFGDVFL